MSISEHLGRQVQKAKSKSKEHEKSHETFHRPGHAERVHIEKADNGYSVQSHEENDRMGYKEPEHRVFGHKDHKKMMKHVSECLGCGEAEEDRDAGGAPKKEREQEKN